VLDDDRSIDKSAVTRVLLHAGKIHWDLKAELDKNSSRRAGAASPSV
jgi:2-oxoglutarate decarboxylase